MLDFISTNWIWILLIGGMAVMHLGHGGHGRKGGHGGHGGKGGHVAKGGHGGIGAEDPMAQPSDEPRY